MTGKLQKETNQAKLSYVFPHAHIESQENPSFRLWPSRFRREVHILCSTPSKLYATNKEAHKQKRRKTPHFGECSKLSPACKVGFPDDSANFNSVFTHILHNIEKLTRMHCELGFCRCPLLRNPKRPRFTHRLCDIGKLTRRH